MTENLASEASAANQIELATYQPLLREDPPKIGDFWLDSRADATAAGVVYTGHGVDNVSVLLVLLAEGAADDRAARDRFSGAVNELDIDTVVARGGDGQDEGRLGKKYRHENDYPSAPHDLPLAPWVALRNDGSAAGVAEGRRLLARVDLSTLPQLGSLAGPDYQLPWVEKTQPGRWRLWPMPWPGRYDRAGWITLAVSWLLMIVIAAIAVTIAIILFRRLPPTPPPPPVPTTMTSPASASPRSSSASPSNSSSPSSSASPSNSASASPTPSGTSANASGSPAPSDEGTLGPRRKL